MKGKQSVLIIGGGIGGLVCGAILSKEGYSVRVLEKHTVAGGGLHTFKRNGVEWETGVHVISGFQPDGVLRRLFNYLTITSSSHPEEGLEGLLIKPANPDGFDHFHVASDGITYKMAVGRENFVATLGAHFPEEKENIRRYIDRVYEICDGVALFNLQAPSADIYSNTEIMSKSVSELIASYTSNPKLQALLAWNNVLYGGEKEKTPAYVGALITQFYIEGASRFVGGTQQLADLLVAVIEQNNGEVLTGNGARFIDIQDRHIQKVIADDGEEFTADWYISAIHTSAMFKLMDLSKIQKSYYQRIDNIPNSYSTFAAFITFKPQSFPYLNYTGYYAPDYDDVWKCAEYTNETWPRGCMYLTPPVTENDVFAQKMIVNTIMNFDTVRQWENTTVGKRGDDYLAFKKQCEEKLLNMLEKPFPDIRSKIDNIFCASPLTIRDYYGSKEGANYGTVKDCNNMIASNISIRTKIDNLLLTGQNINLHGILGVPLTAIATCGELLGMEYLLGKINGEGK
ncbi:MAG: NAD(P)/FAD-dependent oxidoreductase [Bacteroidales bacterium]|nr:NAD(P)/FAD-dependent oxidoreductase [Bacteroidales bacterium]